MSRITSQGRDDVRRAPVIHPMEQRTQPSTWTRIGIAASVLGCIYAAGQSDWSAALAFIGGGALFVALAVSERREA